MKTPLSALELWEVIGGGCTIKAFGRIFPGREYVLAKTHAKALELARIKTGIINVRVTHPDFSGILQ